MAVKIINESQTLTEKLNEDVFRIVYFSSSFIAVLPYAFNFGIPSVLRQTPNEQYKYEA